jgi:phage terminase large subunit GpA-like protein
MLCSPEAVADALIDGLRPDPLLLVSEWADQHRVLSSKASSEPGRWRTDRTPYLREVMDSLSRLDPVQVVVVVAGAQLGKTEAGLNWIGATVDGSPGPMLAVQPTLDIAKRFSRQRVTPLIDETPALKAKVRPARDRDSGNTMLSKEYPGGILMMTGSNSGAGLRSMPVRDLFMDEVDAYPGDVDGEGDPVDLAIARTRTFARRKILITSTPTVAGSSRIWNLWEQSDQRVFEVPCPECGHRQTIEWDRIHYDPADIEKGASLACTGCGVLIEERHKGRMLAAGEWRALNPGSKVRGFHISSLYSPLGWFSWVDAAVMHEKARGDADRMRVFENTVLGRPWQEVGDSPPWEELYRRREPYPVGTVPPGGLLLTAGCDVQRNRLEVEIVAWGPDLESWSVEYLVLEGDTSTIQADPERPCPWRELSKLLQREWGCAGGGSLPLARLAVDSGDQTAVVYEWVRRQHDLRVMATKGMDSQAGLLGMPKAQDVTIRGKLLKGGVKLWPLGSGTGKRELYGWLRMDQPLEGEKLPRGWCHFPEYGEGFFQGLTAEQLVCKTVRGFPKWQWEKTRSRNEQLDCRVMARAALAATGADRWSVEQWEERAGRVGLKISEKLKRMPRPAAVVKAAASQPDAAVEAKTERKRKRRGWLESRHGGRWL